MSKIKLSNIAVLTSGGDAPGMNAAIRAVIRTALTRGIAVYAIHDGYRGMVAGGDNIMMMDWDSVGGILQQGGTVIGTARSDEFRTREGRRKAALNLIREHIDRLVVIGGDGSLTGANLFRQEWPDLIKELVDQNLIDQETAESHPHLLIVGLVGSIDNDMFGTDMTIGADTALHRITEAIDALSSTAASHNRTFVVEVMGRHCGYLALMGAIATGADWVLIPENPPEENWEDELCRALESGRDIGRQHGIVVIAEGAHDRNGNPITSTYTKQVLETRLGEEVRVTILGHVQRGGAPSAFDRYLGTVQGYAALEELLNQQPDQEPQLVGIRQHGVVRSSLVECVAQTQEVARVIQAQDFDTALKMRGGSFAESYRIFRTILRSHPNPAKPGERQHNFAILHAGGLAPGMNTAVRAAVRLGMDKGHRLLSIGGGFPGLISGDVSELGWMSISGWVSRGGAGLGTSRHIPAGRDFYAIAKNLEAHQVDGLLIIGGWAAYQGAYELFNRRNDFPSFNIPIICLPASIDNNLPGTELSIGADTALNNIVTNVDKIKQSAVASRRCFVVEVMGRDCGYLALLSGMATGAEKAYLPEEPITLADLQGDVAELSAGFRGGKRLGLMIRNEYAGGLYDTKFMSTLFEQEGGGLFDVRQAILGHVQQGGNPSPFDRIQATRLASQCIDFLHAEVGKPTPAASMIGLKGGEIQFTSIYDFPRLIEPGFQRPKEQWWLKLCPIAATMDQPPTKENSSSIK
ncbi:MAG: 6-phosphofructokinase [Chloroflexota bacterium]|nr:MAG: 6-phosphofructokinase [Chloroflexota bacterium]